jgi:hypothetical protein
MQQHQEYERQYHAATNRLQTTSTYVFSDGGFINGNGNQDTPDDGCTCCAWCPLEELTSALAHACPPVDARVVQKTVAHSDSNSSAMFVLGMIRQVRSAEEDKDGE